MNFHVIRPEEGSVGRLRSPRLKYRMQPHVDGIMNRQMTMKIAGVASFTFLQEKRRKKKIR